MIVRRLLSPSIASRDDANGEVVSPRQVAAQSWTSNARPGRGSFYEHDARQESHGDARATSSRSKSPLAKDESFVLSLPTKPPMVMRTPSVGKDVAESSQLAPGQFQNCRSLSPQRRVVPLVRRPTVKSGSSRFSNNEGWSSSDIIPCPTSAIRTSQVSHLGRADAFPASSTGHLRVAMPGVGSARTASPVRVGSARATSPPRPAATSTPWFTGPPQQVSNRISAPQQLPAQGAFMNVKPSPRGSPEVASRGPFELAARTPPMVSSPALPSHRATLPAKLTQVQHSRDSAPPVKVQNLNALSSMVTRTSAPTASSSSSAGPILVSSPRESGSCRMASTVCQQAEMPAHGQAVPLTARLVMAELQEARRLGDRKMYEEALAKAEAVGAHPRRSRHANMAFAVKAAHDLGRERHHAERAASGDRADAMECGSSAGLDMSDSLSTDPGGVVALSPVSIGHGSFQVSVSIDVSQSLNFELSPIKRNVDTPSHKVVDALPVRPKFDLSGLSDSVCTSNVSSPDNSVIIDTVDTVIEKMCDIGFGIDTEELLTQDEAQAGSVETPLLVDCGEPVLQLRDDSSTPNLLIAGDTGSTELRSRLCESLEGDLNRIDQKILALRELDETPEKEERSSFELHDAPSPDADDSDEDRDQEFFPTVRGSIPIECTMLLYLRNCDCSPTMMTVIVPEGLREDRLIRVPHERKNFEFVVPPGVYPGEHLSVSIPRVPPLDSESKVQIMNQLSHPLKWKQSFTEDGQEEWICDETRKESRVQHYQEMRGSNMNPTVATIYEDEIITDEPFVTPSCDHYHH